MKYSITAFVLTAAVAGSLAPATIAATHKRASAPVVITRPAIPDGSNASRAPFVAERRMDDVTPPNGEAVDQNVPPNTPSTTPDPVPPPPPAFAILQPRGGGSDLTPTGRPTVAASTVLAPAATQTTIRNAAFESRDDMIDNLRTRVRQSSDAITQFRRTESEMSASGRTLFQSAADDVRAKEKALERSLRAAGRASSANWDAARAQLAADYEAYAAAVSHLDTVVGVTPAQ